MPSISGSVLFSSTSSATGGAGISGIPIVLQNIFSNVGAIVLTDASGNYQFNNVPDGSYRIVEAFGTTGGTLTPKDFSTAVIINSPIPKDPTVASVPSPPANTNQIVSLSRNTIPITISGNNITGQDFRDGPVRNIPIVINDMNLVATNLITAVDNGTWGSNPVGTPHNTTPATNPYPANVDFGYRQTTSSDPQDGNYSIINISTLDTFGWWNMSNHTTGDETGRFQLVNGANPGTLVFKQTVSNVKPNTYHMISVWIANLGKSTYTGWNLPSLGVRLKNTSGVSLYNVVLNSIAMPALPTWNQVSTILNTGNNTDVILEIYSNGNAGNGNDYAIDDILLQECVVNPDLITTKEFVDKQYADVGDTLTYTTVIKNGGNSTTNIVIKDSLPNGTSFVTGTLAIDGITIPAATIVPSGYNTGRNLTNGQVLTISYKVLVNTLPSPSIVTNTGITDYDFLPVAGGTTVTPRIISNSVITTINYGSIYTTKTANKTNVGLADTLTYNLTMKNIGSTVVKNVVVTSTIPLGSTFINNSLDYNGTNISGVIPTNFNIGALEVNEAQTISYKVLVTTIPTVSTISNSATVTFNYVVDPSLPTGKNSSINTAVVTNYLKYPILNITKSSNKDYFIPGETITYTIVANNTGTATAKNIILQDTIPDETTFITNSVYINGTITTSTPNYLNIGSLASGVRSTVTFKVKVNT